MFCTVSYRCRSLGPEYLVYAQESGYDSAGATQETLYTYRSGDQWLTLSTQQALHYFIIALMNFSDKS